MYKSTITNALTKEVEAILYAGTEREVDERTARYLSQINSANCTFTITKAPDKDKAKTVKQQQVP